MKLKNKYKKIFLLLLIVLVSGLLLNSVYAAVTINKNGNEDSVGFKPDGIGDEVNEVLQIILDLGSLPISGFMAAITNVNMLLGVILFVLLQTVFIGATGDITHMPMPDTIVFNKFAFFDANFINPAYNSILYNFGDILKNLFESFRIVAIAVFIIAAMIAGLKVALSTIASTKAQYKEAAMKWVTGFIILLCLKIILAGIFYINEYIVAILYSATDSAKIPIPVFNAVPVIGRPINELIKATTGTVVGPKVAGYVGIVLANMVKAVGGDLIASIIGFVILGQTLTIIGSYLKRVFMALLLGIVSPLIVATDTIMAVQGKQSNVFKNWLKNFSLTVFMQSIHAMYMLVALQLISSMYSDSAYGITDNWVDLGFNDIQVGIITIVLTTGLVKLEKLFKSLFGIGDSFAGDLKDGAKGMLKAMGAVRGVKEGLSSVMDNRKKAADAGKKKKAYMSALGELKDKVATKGAGGGSGSSSENNNTNNNNTTNNTTINNNNSDSGESKKDKKITADNYLDSVIKEHALNLTDEEKIQQLEAAIAHEHAIEKGSLFADFMGIANLSAGLGVGLGMGDEFSESLFRGGYITKGLDFAAEKIGYASANGERKEFAKQEKEDGEKYGYTPSDKIVQKPVISLEAVNKEIEKIGKTFGKSLSKELDAVEKTRLKRLKEIDRDLDNE